MGKWTFEYIALLDISSDSINKKIICLLHAEIGTQNTSTEVFSKKLLFDDQNSSWTLDQFPCWLNQVFVVGRHIWHTQKEQKNDYFV